MPGVNNWLSVARTADPDDLREQILTGYKGGKPFTPYLPTLQLPSPIDTLLDFGCGVGRSFPHLKTIARHVVGFDLPPMIERCRALALESIDLLSDDWDEIRGRRFDLIVAALVLQHVEPGMCRFYLQDMARMAPFVYLLTRVQNDYGPNVFDLIAESGLFVGDECIQVEHDSSTHQLRVLGRRRFDEASRYGSADHYEVLLRSQRMDRR